MPYREQYQTIDRKVTDSLSFRALFVAGTLAIAFAGALIVDYVKGSASNQASQTQTYQGSK